MSLYFVDTSALAKRYLPEVGAAWVRGWVNPRTENTIIISALSTVEFVSLLARRQREGSLSIADFARLRNDFLIHAQREYRLIAINHYVLLLAQRLLLKHSLRTLDAIQLASAIMTTRTVNVLPFFVSADKKLLAIATVEGFPTDDPNAHP